MAYQQKPNRGSLFKNEEKGNDEDRDYSGSLNVEGRVRAILDGAVAWPLQCASSGLRIPG